MNEILAKYGTWIMLVVGAVLVLVLVLGLELFGNIEGAEFC